MKLFIFHNNLLLNIDYSDPKGIIWILEKYAAYEKTFHFLDKIFGVKKNTAAAVLNAPCLDQRKSLDLTSKFINRSE